MFPPVRAAAIMLLVLALGLAAPALAAPPALITYQAQVYASSGQPLSATADLTFALYDSIEGGEALWTESHSGVELDDGVAEVILGSITPLGLDFDQTYYLGISVNGGSELIPRQALTSAPYASRAVRADTADTAQAVEAGVAVTGLNGATGAVTMTGNAPIGVSTVGQTITISSDAVASLNGASGAVTITGTDPVSVATDGQTITISSSTDSVNSVTAGAGLSNNGTANDPVLAVDFVGDGSADTVARSDHLHDDAYYTQTELQTAGSSEVNWYNLTGIPMGPYTNVITVAKSGAQFTSIQSAIDSIGDASAGNPYLVWVGPGIYTEAVTLRDYVHLQGSGHTLTTVTAPTGSQTALTLGNQCKVSDLLVKTSQADVETYGIKVPASCTVDLCSVDVEAKVTGVVATYGIHAATNSTVRLSDMEVVATVTSGDGEARGIYADTCSLAASGVTVDATSSYSTMGLYYYVAGTSAIWEASLANCTLSSEGGSSANVALGLATDSLSGDGAARVRMINSRLISDNVAAATNTDKCALLMAGSELDGTVGGSGAETCIGCYDSGFNGLGTDCQ